MKSEVVCDRYRGKLKKDECAPTYDASMVDEIGDVDIDGCCIFVLVTCE